MDVITKKDSWGEHRLNLGLCYFCCHIV
uniref:Uncharacterized protein n=1 Tax=Rhizophora mucronata TaxID=61149 RepID=A0A2P2J4E9_RHIMU